MTPPVTADDLDIALALARAADEISLARFHAADLAVESKPDHTPVTDADLAVEKALRAILAERRPADAIVGEEFGGGQDPAERAAHGRVWIIDPIDGTKNFLRGVPIWATLIALLVDGEPAVGVVSAPALARRWWADTHGEAWTSFDDGAPRRLHVSGVTSLDDASLSLSDYEEWAAVGKETQIRDLSARCWRSRGYGDFYSYVLVAEGAVDIAAEPELNLWDLAALVPIVRSAAGRFTTAEGGVINSHSTSALATNGALHAATLGVLAT